MLCQPRLQVHVLQRSGEAGLVSVWKPPQYQHFPGVEAQKFGENGKHLFDAFLLPDAQSMANSESTALQLRLHEEHSDALHELLLQTQLLSEEETLAHVCVAVRERAAVAAVAVFESDAVDGRGARMAIALVAGGASVHRDPAACVPDDYEERAGDKRCQCRKHQAQRKACPPGSHAIRPSQYNMAHLHAILHDGWAF